MLGLEVLTEDFNNEEQLVWGEKLKAAADKKDEQCPSIPATTSVFKKDTKWSVQKEQFLDYMGT